MNKIILSGILSGIFLLTSCASSQSFKKSLELEPSEKIRSINGKNIAVFSKFAEGSLDGVVGLHLWNSFQITIKNLSNKSIDINTIKTFALLNKATGEQYNPLSLDGVYTNNTLPSYLGGLEKYQKDAIAKVYFNDGLLLPNATKTGIIFFDKNNFDFKSQTGVYKLFLILKELNETLEIDM